MITKSEFLKQYDNLSDLLFGFAMRLTRNSIDASDLLQETFYKAYKNKDHFKSGTNFKAWMTTIMYNSYVNRYRKQKTRSRVSVALEDLPLSPASSKADASPDSQIMLKDLWNIVNSLSDTYKVPFMMSYEGYQYNEISKHLNIPMGTVKSRINYARKLLKEKIIQNYSISLGNAA